MDPLKDSLEEFYGDDSWQQNLPRKCGHYRVPGGRVVCSISLLDNGLHYGNHRGYDAAARAHTWNNANPAIPASFPGAFPGAYMGLARRPESS